MEEVCRARDAREGEVSTGVEKQKCTSEVVHDASAAPRSHDLCCQVSQMRQLNNAKRERKRNTNINLKQYDHKVLLNFELIYI